MMKISVAILVIGLVNGCFAADNGLAQTPPMGWRSWNCFLGDISEAKIKSVLDLFRSKARNVDGVPTSLVDLGYRHVGIDDGWQECGAGSEQPTSFHDASGTPILNTSKFNNLASLVSYATQYDMELGWYINNCICHESKSHIHNDTWVDLTYHGDVKQVVDAGFSGLKIDSCGLHSDLNKYADLINATGHPVLIENCHQGGDTPTNLSWCPYNMYRTSNDIRSNWGSVFGNLHTVEKYNEHVPPLSRPGCWAYPDMMEVGRLASFEEDRSHFGGWAIVSSPLILGLDVLNTTLMDYAWPIIANKEAIAVNQAWAGHPGSRVNVTTAVPTDVDVWMKPVSSTCTAVLAVNMNAKQATASSLTFTVNDFGFGPDNTCTISVRDIWKKADTGTTTKATFTVDALQPHDSWFGKLCCGGGGDGGDGGVAAAVSI